MNEYKWIDIEDQQPEYNQHVWCIPEKDWNKRYVEKDYSYPDEFDVIFGDYIGNGYVEYNCGDVPPVEIKKWFPFPKL